MVPVALIANALVIDNGKVDGIAGLIGQAAKQLDQSPFLLGILSPNENAPDSNHSALLRLPAEWDDIAKSSFLLTAEFARKQDGIRPVAALLIGGGESDMATALRCARRGWPLLIVQGAGGLGDMILSASAPPAEGSQAAPIAEPGSSRNSRYCQHLVRFRSAEIPMI